MKEKKAKSADSNGASKRGLIIGVVALVAVIAIAAIAYNALAPAASSQTDQLSEREVATSPDGPSTGNEERTEAPDFAMVTADGEVISFSQLRGKPVVLNFWASTCGPCQQEMPGFQAAFDEYGSQVQFAMVDVVGFNGETEDRAQRFIADEGYTFPVFYDREGDASIQYSLTSIPRTFFIDAEGYVVAMGSGMLDESSLERGISMLL